MADWLIQGCDVLGLFQTRMPRFTQLFFHDFSEDEKTLEIGQSSSPSSSLRAAKAFLESGVRLESKSGLSDVWYHYVETNRHLFEEPGSSFPVIPKAHYPRLNVTDAPSIYNLFEWLKHHTTPRSTKKQLEATTSIPLFGSKEVDALELSNSEVLSSSSGDYEVYNMNASYDYPLEGAGDVDYFGQEHWTPLFWRAAPEPSLARDNPIAAIPRPKTIRFVPSSVSDELELHIEPDLLDVSLSANSLGGEAPMEGVERTQPFHGQILRNNEDTTRDGEYTHDGESNPLWSHLWL